ncbi:carboxypeptidase-like regulatory domain-containing protein [Natrinema halophilum]|uniref:Carboxypeptidase regulatory-like domain-containing protein n=1 Tax=Natrinema halophilum TaxID=1699371 RepID=A0A7D5KQN9_9EURY|nr:carboxypeptidase-like regulatory domain-containing protein [Natrinema halophilum]QLG48537.1 carboxypeptidase-like regulatory domain-containing protein [Natrinema halophilum]
MNRLVLLVAVGLCLAALVGVGAAQSNEEKTVTVHVVDDVGNDVGGASVTASWEGGERTGQTASNGQTLIDVPTDASVSIAVDHDDYVQNNPVQIGTVTDHTTETVTVCPPTDGEIAVTENGNPIETATVTLTKRGDDRAAAEGTTDANGIFATTDLETGDYDVTVRKPGYYEETTTVDLNAVNGTTVEVESGMAEVTFTVSDGHLEQPLEVDVTVLNDGERDSTVSTNENGQRSIDLAVNTEYTVRIDGEGYGEHERKLTVGETDTNRRYQIERSPSLTLEAANERIILGETVGVTVTDEYGEPVDEVAVRIGGSKVATTDADGSATVPIETAGSLEVTAAIDGTVSNAVVVEGIDPNADEDEDEDDDTARENTDNSSETLTSDDSVPGFGAPAALVIVALLVGKLAFHQR